MNTITATKARNNFFPLIKTTVKTHSITKIKSRSGDVILLSEEEYEELLETAELSLIPDLKASLVEADENIKNGEVYSLEEAFAL